MIRNRFILKLFAVFCVLEMLVNTALSPISWALTAGPSAPEFSSFEPVDTTDMVNVATGELVYNTPLLEVPGPSGGYPLSLSYHSGIRPEQESSWVGLGFTLNPGAISRTVNGFADDNVNARRQVKDYWDGGKTVTKTYTFGLNTPVQGLTANLTIARSRDTFKGFSVKAYGGLSFSPIAFALSGVKDSYTKDMAVRTNTKGDVVPNAQNTAAGGLRTVIFEKGAGMLSSAASLDLSIGSNGVNGSASLGGHTYNQKNNSAFAISSFTNVNNKGTAPLFGLGYLTLKDYYTRYWSDQSDALFTFGSLYSAKSNALVDHYDNSIQDNASEFQAYANDIYHLNEAVTGSTFDVKDEADPSKQIGGSLPAYDQYTVAGQGISGAIEPYIFENGDMRGQNLYYRDPTFGHPYSGGHTLKYNSLRQFSNKQVDFRFKNDFSNSLTVSPATITESGGVLGTTAHTVTADAATFDNSATRQKLEGSRHIDWYTNDQIVNGSAKAQGFIDYYASPSQRTMTMDIYDNYLQPEAFVPVDNRNYRGKLSGIFKTDQYTGRDPYADFVEYESTGSIRFQSLKPTTVSLAERIGGFKITNESGVTYHYALPVYAYNEYTRTKLKKPYKGAATITEVKNNEPYAYTWLLTAITGPDYVDRSAGGDTPNGILDDADFGYWVKFDYGKWTDSYQWRTPHTGYSTDPESDYMTFSYGIKELYYLDAIETKSHKAIFMKSKKKDGRGVTSRLEGGSNPREYNMKYKSYNTVSNSFTVTGSVKFSVSPVATLKLDAVYLFDKKDWTGLGLSKDTGAKYNHGPYYYDYTGSDYTYNIPFTNPQKTITIKQGEDRVVVKYHNGDQVFDDGDVADIGLIKAKAIKVVEFKTDYSLAKNVPNSIAYIGDFGYQCTAFPYPETPYTCDIENEKLEFEWPISKCLIVGGRTPECCNETDRERFYSRDPLLYIVNNSLPDCVRDFTDYRGASVYYGTTGKLTLKELSILGHGGARLIPPTAFSYKKNPDYSSARYDEWGFYKSDYHDVSDPDFQPTEYMFADDIQGTKKITSSSSQNADAWSLSSITSPLGTEMSIAYEGNTYSKSVYNDNHVFGIDKVERVGEDKIKIRLREKGMNLSNYFAVNGTVGVRAMVVSKINAQIVTYPSTPDIYNSAADNIVSIGVDELVLTAPQLNQYLKAGRTKIVNAVPVYLTPYFISGAIIIPEAAGNQYAGGIRVKAISVQEFAGHKSTTEYSYNKPGTTISSGVTSYKPYNAISVNYPTEIDFFSGMFNDKGDNNGPHIDEGSKKKLIEYKTEFQKILNQLNDKVLRFGREAPAPGVIYEYVTVRNKSDALYQSSYTVNQFKVFREEMITLQANDYGTPEKQRRNVILRNEASDIGNPVAESTYSTQDNLLLYQKKYGYLYGDENKSFETPIQNLKQGFVEQSFHKHITLTDWHWRGYAHSPFIEPTSITEKAVVTKKEERTNVITTIEEKNFKTGSGTVSEYHNFDMLTGVPLKTITTDQYGNRYSTESVPAYSLKNGSTTIYPGMGIKLFNPLNKGMLAQGAATYAYRLGASDQPAALVSGGVQTWSKNNAVMHESGVGLSADVRQQDIWRKRAGYVWRGDDRSPGPDGHYPIAYFQTFNFQTPASNSAQWLKTDEITLYDVQSHALMAMDINGNHASTRMSGDHTRVIATAVNAKYHEFVFSGAEDNLNPDQTYGGAVKKGPFATEVVRLDDADEVTAHTGSKALQVTSPNQKAFSYTFTTEPGRAYHASVWVNAEAGRLYYKINGGAPQVPAVPVTSKKAGAWYLVTLDIPVIASSSTLEVWCETTGATCNFDDFRVHPYDAAMVSYVYNRWGEVSHMLDNNNLFTGFKYDGMGSLVETHRETFNHNVVKTAEAIYHYHDLND